MNTDRQGLHVLHALENGAWWLMAMKLLAFKVSSICVLVMMHGCKESDNDLAEKMAEQIFESAKSGESAFPGLVWIDYRDGKVYVGMSMQAEVDLMSFVANGVTAAIAIATKRDVVGYGVDASLDKKGAKTYRGVFCEAHAQYHGWLWKSDCPGAETSRPKQ